MTPQEPTTLIVFNNQCEAQEAGFIGSTHPKMPHLRAAWASSLMTLLGISPQVVIASRYAASMITKEGRIRDILRARQMVFGDDALYLEF